MSYSIVYPNGEAVSVAVAASDVVTIKSAGKASVYQVTSYVDRPNVRVLLKSVDNAIGSTSAFSAAGTVEIEGGASEVHYSIGTGAVVSDDGKYQYQSTPGVLNATGALTAAMILSGIVTSTTGAAVAGTVPTGTVMDASSSFSIDDSVDFSVIATGGNAFTVTAASGITLVGDAVVATATAGLFRLRKTAANTFVIYRLAK